MKDRASLTQRYNPKLIRAIKKARKELEAEKGIPWETVKKQLGLSVGLKIFFLTVPGPGAIFGATLSNQF